MPVLRRKLNRLSILSVLLGPALATQAAAQAIDPVPAPFPPAAPVSVPSPATAGSVTPGQAPTELQWMVRAGLAGATHGWLGGLEPGAAIVFLQEPGPDGARNSINVPRVSPGVGFRVGAGAIVRRLGTNIGVSAGISYERLTHATSFPMNWTSASPTWESTPTATVHVMDLELRIIFERWRAKPYFALSPGWTQLDLPGMGTFSAPRQGISTVGLDVSMPGWCAGASLGLLYEISSRLMATGQVGYRLSGHAPREGDGTVTTSRFSLGLGLELWL